jgi:hypothetical protein
MIVQHSRFPSSIIQWKLSGALCDSETLIILAERTRTNLYINDFSVQATPGFPLRHGQHLG